jgi:hypothetical protein
MQTAVSDESEVAALKREYARMQKKVQDMEVIREACIIESIATTVRVATLCYFMCHTHTHTLSSF